MIDEGTMKKQAAAVKDLKKDAALAELSWI